MSLLIQVALPVVLAAAVAVVALRVRAMSAAARAAQARAASLRADAGEVEAVLRTAAGLRPVAEAWDAGTDARLAAALGAFEAETVERRVEVRPDTRTDDRRRSRPTRTHSPRLRRDP